MQKTVNGITYELQETEKGEKVATILQATYIPNRKKEIVVYEDVDGYVVTEVGKNAFDSSCNTEVEVVRFFATIKKIGVGAFSPFLVNLKSVEFMARQETPEFCWSCFLMCENLEGIYFANHKKFGKIFIEREHAGGYSTKQEKLIQEILSKSDKGAFYRCWKMPVILEEH